jgi:antitoxin StbD
MGSNCPRDGRPRRSNDNESAFYCVPAKAYEALMDRLEDVKLNALADARLNDSQAIVKVSLDEL